jgi:asparagine synthase (glutamine-hydrolysing)
MAAIAGWVTGRSAPDAEALVAPLEALAHRGADDPRIATFQSESGHRVALGHAYYDEEAGIAVALDGPIANRAALEAALVPRGHRFQAGTAAETLVRAYEHWDKDVLHHLRGAFAFALWDARKERLMLARDRFGEKPLYLCERAGALHFASQISALVRMPGIAARPDTGAMRDYLAYRYVPGPRTLVEGIRKLAPGSHALWQFGRLREARYWIPPDRNANTKELPGNAVEQFTEKLDDAVSMHAGAAVLLSGGLDSAALVALASRHGKVKTFAAGFAEDPASELAGAARVAQHFGAEHHEIVLSPRDVIERLAQIVVKRDAPLSRPADVALHFIACEAARTARTALTGEGADEVLGGYRRHVAERYGWGLRSMPTFLLLCAPFTRRRPRLRTALDSLRTPDWRARILRWVGVLSDREARALSGVDVGRFIRENNNPPFDADPCASSLRRALYFDQSSWLPDNVLERTDRMTMAASLEARAPFLDHRLVEFVSALPDALRVRGLATKWILRRALRPLLAELRPRKAGFAIPLGAWLRGELAEWLLDHLRGAGSLTRPFYDAATLDRLLDEHLAGRRNHEDTLWTLLNLEIWHRACRPG